MSDRLAQLEKMLKAEPGDAFCLYGLAMEFSKLGRHDEALARFDDAIKADPDHCYSYYHKARLLDELDQSEAAIQTIQAGLERAAATADAHAADELRALLDHVS